MRGSASTTWKTLHPDSLCDTHTTCVCKTVSGGDGICLPHNYNICLSWRNADDVVAAVAAVQLARRRHDRRGGKMNILGNALTLINHCVIRLLRLYGFTVSMYVCVCIEV